MTARIQRLFLLLAMFQALHSLEEYLTRLWEHLAPARFLSGLVSSNPSFGFAVINVLIVALIFASYLGPIRKASDHARGIAWFWAVLETLNGFGHVSFGIAAGGYFPGLYSAPFLLLIGAALIVLLARPQTASPG